MANSCVWCMNDDCFSANIRSISYTIYESWRRPHDACQHPPMAEHMRLRYILVRLGRIPRSHLRSGALIRSFANTSGHDVSSLPGTSYAWASSTAIVEQLTWGFHNKFISHKQIIECHGTCATCHKFQRNVTRREPVS